MAEPNPNITAFTPLTKKQEQFCNEYLVDLNGAQAAIRAGYSKKTAHIIASQNLSKLNIASVIDKKLEERAEKTKINAEWVLLELAKLYRANVFDYMKAGKDGKPYIDLTQVTREQMSVISEVFTETTQIDDKVFVGKTKVKLVDKLKTLETIGKHVNIGAWKETQQQINNDNRVTEIKVLVVNSDGQTVDSGNSGAAPVPALPK